MNKKVLWIIVVLIIFIFVAGYFVLKSEAFDYTPVYKCQGIKPGATLQTVIPVLGEPISKKPQDGYELYIFKYPALAPTWISALVDEKTGQVIELSCAEENRATWDVRKGV